VNQFVKVFDVLDSGYRDWPFLVFGLTFVVVGIVLVAFPKIIKRLRIPNAPYLNGGSAFQAIFPYLFLGLALLFTVMAFPSSQSYSFGQFIVLSLLCPDRRPHYLSEWAHRSS
jgi:hypothetical protein